MQYLEIAHENDPLDFDVMLKLGWTYNMLKDDKDAVRWFDLARRSPDPTIAAEASKAYRNLKPGLERFRTTIWAFPTFSTRWHDLFAYAQVKTELRLPGWFVHPYVSVRFIGDTKGAVNVANLGPQYLSERSVIVGLGVATNPWHGATGWFEAGESLRYSPTYDGSGPHGSRLSRRRLVRERIRRTARARRRTVCSPRPTTTEFTSAGSPTIRCCIRRIAPDTRFRSTEGVGDFHAQLYWNWNVTVDALGQYWANYVETGPGDEIPL